MTKTPLLTITDSPVESQRWIFNGCVKLLKRIQQLASAGCQSITRLSHQALNRCWLHTCRLLLLDPVDEHWIKYVVKNRFIYLLPRLDPRQVTEQVTKKCHGLCFVEFQVQNPLWLFSPTALDASDSLS